MKTRIDSGLDRVAAASVAALLTALTGCSHARPAAQDTKLSIARVLPKSNSKPVVLVPFALSWSDPGGANLLDVALEGATPVRAPTPLPLLNADDGRLSPAVVTTAAMGEGFGADGSQWYLAGLPVLFASAGHSSAGGGTGPIGWTNDGVGYTGSAGAGPSPHGGPSSVSSYFTRYGGGTGDGPRVFTGQTDPGISTSLAGQRPVLEGGSDLGGGFGGAGTGASSNSFLGSSFGPPAGDFFPEFASDIGMPGGSVADFSTNETFTSNELALTTDGLSDPAGADEDLAPEPSAMMMLGLGLIGITGVKRRRRK